MKSDSQEFPISLIVSHKQPKRVVFKMTSDENVHHYAHQSTVNTEVNYNGIGQNVNYAILSDARKTLCEIELFNRVWSYY